MKIKVCHNANGTVSVADERNGCLRTLLAGESVVIGDLKITAPSVGNLIQVEVVRSVVPC